MLSKEQKRSKFALQKLDNLYANNQIDKDLANFIVGTPTMILQNGFGQTMAFLIAKGNDTKGTNSEEKRKYNFVYETIIEWAHRENPDKIKTDKKEFLEAISKLDQNEYVKIQEETLKLLQWLKRYARAFQVDENKGE